MIFILVFISVRLLLLLPETFSYVDLLHVFSTRPAGPSILMFSIVPLVMSFPLCCSCFTARNVSHFKSVSAFLFV